MWEKTLESPLDSKEIQPVHPKGNQSWIFIGRTDAETEIPILWPPDARNWLTGKDSDAGKNLRQEEKGTTEDEMVRWQHWLDGHEFEQAAGIVDGQGSLGCCSPWGHQESDRTEWLNWTDWIHFEFIFVYGVRECSNLILLHVALQFSQHHILKRLLFSIVNTCFLWCMHEYLNVCAAELPYNLSLVMYISLNTHMLGIFCCLFKCTLLFSLPCFVRAEADLGVPSFGFWLLVGLG